MSGRPWHKHYPRSVPTDQVFQESWRPHQLAESAHRFPGRTAIIFQNARLSYRELDDQVNRFSTALTRLGVGRGDRVAIQLPNIPQCVIAFYGALRIGAIPSMTNPL